MNDQFTPPHTPASTFIPQPAPADSMAQTKPLQRPAAALSSTQVQTPAYDNVPERTVVAPTSPQPVEPETPDSDFTVSVDDVRARMADLKINKSKDTIQRYCREGDLECRKLGLMKRYYATPKSVEQLISTMHPVAAASGSTPVHEVAEPEKVAADNNLHAGVEEPLPVHEAAHAAAPTSTPVHTSAAVLEAQLVAANERIADLIEEREFLREEVREGRTNRSDVTTIAERMLGTLEAMALGGRLTKAASNDVPKPTEARDVLAHE